MKQLVKKSIDGRLSEVDIKATLREALVLQRYIDEAPAEEQEKFKYREWLQPVIDAALNGTLPTPYRDDPYSFHLMAEGILPQLPEQLMVPYCTFMNRIEGTARMSSCSTIEGGRYQPGASEVIIDGERYEWVVFED